MATRHSNGRVVYGKSNKIPKVGPEINVKIIC